MGKITQTLQDTTTYTLEKLYLNVWNKPEILMVGLKGSGKTTIMNQKMERDNKIIQDPILGINRLELSKFTIRSYNLGGYCQFQLLLDKFYLSNYIKEAAIVFVLDCNDEDLFEDAKEELKILLSKRMDYNKPLLIFANKQDLNGSVTKQGVIDALELDLYYNLWKVQEISAIKNIGIDEGFEWLLTQIDKK